MHAKFNECYDRESVVTKINHITWMVVIFRESGVTKKMVDQDKETYRNERSEDQVESQEIQSDRGSNEQKVCPRQPIWTRSQDSKRVLISSAI